ncbi:MAG: hypothetical protein JSU00_07980 [Acidobacteria bacterium]|nr:hypothetical protein [Acidobacteriota bacterium]
MTRREQFSKLAKFAVGLAAVPVLLWAYSSGPEAHKTGVPAPGNNEPTCVLCHSGTALNGGGGKVTLTASGNSYTPGQKQTLTITVTDSAAKVYGFQATARLASDLNQQAGSFTPSASQQVICATPSVNDAGGPCSGNSTLQFIEHRQPSTSNVINIDWTPPAAASGDITIYVSANAANRDGQTSGDHIYNTSLTLTAASATPKPVIAEGGIISAAAFGAFKGVSPGTWVEIYGSNLSATTGEWSGGDFNGTTAPTKLGGVTVTIAGKSAFIRYISPGQVNVQAPDGIGTGPVQVVVTSQDVASDPVNITAYNTLPGLLQLGNGYVAAFQGSTIVGSPGFAPVKPGDTIVLYGIGFGPTNPLVPAGQITPAPASGQNTITSALGIVIGGSSPTMSYQGLPPGFVGLYQFNLTVPSIPDGDQPLTVAVGGNPNGQSLKLTVKR